MILVIGKVLSLHDVWDDRFTVRISYSCLWRACIDLTSPITYGTISANSVVRLRGLRANMSRRFRSIAVAVSVTKGRVAEPKKSNVRRIAETSASWWVGTAPAPQLTRNNDIEFSQSPISVLKLKSEEFKSVHLLDELIR